MCLYVNESHVESPIPMLPVYKALWLSSIMTKASAEPTPAFTTSFRTVLVSFGDGYFQSKRPSKRTEEYGHYYEINGGYIHSYSKKPYWDAHANEGSTIDIARVRNPKDTFFKCEAHTVCAHGMKGDLVSRMLYMPQFDLRNYNKKQIERLRKAYPGSFTEHSEYILEQLK